MPAYLCLPLLVAATLLWVLWKSPGLHLRRIGATQVLRALRYAILFIVAAYVSLFLHECGHYGAFWLMNLDHIQMHLGLAEGSVTWGTSTSRLLTPIEFQFGTLAGFAVMRILAAIVDRPVGSNGGFLIAMFFINRFALVHGWQQGFFDKNDFSASTHALAAGTGLNSTWILMLFGAAIGLDLYLGRRRIRANALALLRGLRLIEITRP